MIQQIYITMMTYIALLRGINVSGKNKILMADLRMLFQKLDFENVQTYIQSGNVIFKSDTKQELLSKFISDTIKKEFNLEVPVIIKTRIEMELVVKDNPYLKEENIDYKKLYVVYLNEAPKETTKLDAFDFGKDTYIIKDKIMYIKYDLGAGSTKLSIKIIENKLGIIATARNWRTTNKLVEMASSISK